MPSSAPSTYETTRFEGVDDRPSASRRTLLSRVAAPASLKAALRIVARRRRANGKVRDVTLEVFMQEASSQLRGIRDALRKGRYRFAPLRPVAIEKKSPGEFRPILVPRVADRIVQRAMLNAISTYLAPHVSHKNSHAFREDAGVCSAVYQLRDELRAGKDHVLIIDIVNFFPSVDTGRLFAELQEFLPDDSLNSLLNQLRTWEIDGLASLPWAKRKCFPESGSGLPQGSALSPILSNFYLRRIDSECACNGLTAIRYADDIAVPCTSLEAAQRAYGWIRTALAELNLQVPELGSRKAKIRRIGAARGQGIEYLGFYLSRFADGRISIRPSQQSFMSAKDAITAVLDPQKDDSLATRYAELTYFLNGWLSTFGYVCGVERERGQLLELAQDQLSRLLMARGLTSSTLTLEQQRFLGLQSIFAAAEMRRAVRRAVREGRSRRA